MPMTAADFLRRRLRQIPLTPDQSSAVLREFAGYFFRPTRMYPYMQEASRRKSKRPHTIKLRVACDEIEQACIHCQLAWDLLRLAKRGASPWSGYWTEEKAARVQAKAQADKERLEI